MTARLRLAAPYIVTLAAAGFLYWAAGRIDVFTGGRIGPQAWPKAIIAFMALLCVWEIGKRLLTGAQDDAHGLVSTQRAEEGAAAEPPAEAPTYPARLWGGIGLVAAYVAAVPFTGFFLTTALFLAVFPWLGGLRRPVLAAALGAAGSFVLVFVFMRVAYISLPLGEGPFRAVSLGLLRLLGVT